MTADQGQILAQVWAMRMGPRTMAHPRLTRTARPTPAGKATGPRREHHGAQGADHQPQGEAHAYAYGHDRHEAASLAAGDAEDGHDGTGSQAPLASMEDAGDTIAFARRYESGYRPESVGAAMAAIDLMPIAAPAMPLAPMPAMAKTGTTRVPDTTTIPLSSTRPSATMRAVPEARGLDHVIDLSNSGYPTFQALHDAGALVQVGEDVEITLSVTDPSHPEKVLLRSVNLSSLTSSDFKFG